MVTTITTTYQQQQVPYLPTLELARALENHARAAWNVQLQHKTTHTVDARRHFPGISEGFTLSELESVGGPPMGLNYHRRLERTNSEGFIITKEVTDTYVSDILNALNDAAGILHYRNRQREIVNNSTITKEEK